MFAYIVGSLLGYLLGSIPTAFLLVRWKSRVDIRNAGSGNVGTLNSFQVSGSKLVGLSVLVLDFAKGFVAVSLISSMFKGEFTAGALAGNGAVLGHNFPVWLKFHGGRGLATAAGVFSYYCFPAVVAWGAVWVPGFLISRSVNVANAAATTLLVFILWLAPDDTLRSLLFLDVAPDPFRLFGTVVLSVILVRHVEPVVQFIRKRTSRDRKADT